MKNKKEIDLYCTEKAWGSFVSGNNNVLEFVFKKHHSSLLFTAFYYLKNNEDSLDIVHDVFVKLLEMSCDERRENLSNVHEKLEVFLKVLVKNKCLDKIKVEKNRKSILNGISSFIVRSNKSHTMMDDDFRLMLDLLPEQQKKILELHLDGYDNESIGKQLNISYNTVRNTLSTSKKKIRELWSKFMS